MDQKEEWVRDSVSTEEKRNQQPQTTSYEDDDEADRHDDHLIERE